MCAVTMADQQSCDPTRLASSKWDGQNGQRALMLIVFKDQCSVLLMQKSQNWLYPGQTHINYP